MSGVPYHASDIGGFYGSVQPSAELYLRWLQMSVFSSHMRVHGIGAREPWAFGEENRSDRAAVDRIPLPVAALSEERDRAGHRDRAAGAAGDAARLPGKRADANLRNAVHVRRRAAGRA